MDTSALLEQLEALTKNPPAKVLADDSIRIKLRDAARNFSIAMESKGDTVHRIGSLRLRLSLYNLLARVGIEINLFDILTKHEGAQLSSNTLAEICGVDPILMKRLLRYYASFSMIDEVGVDRYTACNVSRAMVPPGLKAGVNYTFETISGTFMQLPRFLRETDYRMAIDPAHTPWQLAHNTDQVPFEWLMSHPTDFGYFIPWMTAQREGLPIWLDAFPFREQLCVCLTPETPLFIDIGGGPGHQCIALKQRFPDVPGRVIVQDTPNVVKQAIPSPGVEPMAYDFWTPQPIKGARAYYMRNIMHDWPDDRCRRILRNTTSAMTKDSVILIDEMVLPNRGAHWRATQLDITMMTCLAALERSEDQWYALLESAGLEIVKIYKYTDELQDSIIVAVPKEGEGKARAKPEVSGDPV